MSHASSHREGPGSHPRPRDASELHRLARVQPKVSSAGSTADPIAATIRPCRCGVVRTARHPRPRQRVAGSATDRAPPAGPAATSVARLPASSDTAVWTVSAGRSRATRSGPAGRPPTRRARPFRPFPASDRSGRSIRRTREQPFAPSSSWRSRRARARTSSPTRSRCPRGRPASPAGACGATRRPDTRPDAGGPARYGFAGRVPSVTSRVIRSPSRRISTLTV